ncbi:MAG: hypothetical protein EOO06_00015 [Chitinophagaceae bacterium]|nr:MAG: hypothetical protein EOO06_00015 [Chitinophagaceae bacterium]
MGFTHEQQGRLQKEIDILAQYFPSFSFINSGGNVCLEGWMNTNSRNNYKLRLYVPQDIPYSVPDVVIVSPTSLRDYSGMLLTDHGASGSMHLLTPRDGYPKICTYKSTNWNSNVTFYKVLMKVRLWLEALDGHKSNGLPLDYYLKHQ